VKINRPKIAFIKSEKCLFPFDTIHNFNYFCALAVVCSLKLLVLQLGALCLTA